MWIQNIASQVLSALGEERRRVVSDWRILMLARRIARQDGAPLPDETKARAIIKELFKQRAIQSMEGLHAVYAVDVPFARILAISDEQIVQEANPYAVFGYLTAFATHGLTNVIPSQIYATDYDGGDQSRIPLGSGPEDWIDLPRPARKLPKKVRSIQVEWTRSHAKSDFGSTVAYSQGIPIYVTDLERTLIDGLRQPTLCGGISNVVRAWLLAVDSGKLNLENMIDYTDRLDVAVVRQRVGFVLETLKLQHPRLKQWQTRLGRGGSMKLVADAPYASHYSETWNLSLNVPETVLDELRSA